MAYERLVRMIVKQLLELEEEENDKEDVDDSVSQS